MSQLRESNIRTGNMSIANVDDEKTSANVNDKTYVGRGIQLTESVVAALSGKEPQASPTNPNRTQSVISDGNGSIKNKIKTKTVAANGTKHAKGVKKADAAGNRLSVANSNNKIDMKWENSGNSVYRDVSNPTREPSQAKNILATIKNLKIMRCILNIPYQRIPLDCPIWATINSNCNT